MTKETIFEFFKEKGITDLDFDTDLFKGGFINSLFALEMVVFLEDTFEIHIKEEDISERNFKTIAAIADLVERTKGA